MEEDKFCLTATTKQFQIIKSALEFYYRFGSGQIDIALQELCFSNQEQFSKNMFKLTSNDLDVILNSLKREIYDMPVHEAHGVSSPKMSDNFRIANDIYQVIRHGLAHHESRLPRYDVSYDEPIKYSKEELPTLEAVEWVDEKG